MLISSRKCFQWIATPWVDVPAMNSRKFLTPLCFCHIMVMHKIVLCTPDIEDSTYQFNATLAQNSKKLNDLKVYLKLSF